MSILINTDILINAVKFSPDYDIDIFRSFLYENKLSSDDINKLIYKNFQHNSMNNKFHNHTIKISDILIQYTKDMVINEYMNNYDIIFTHCFYNDNINEIYLLEYYIKHVENINRGALKYCLFIAIEKNLVQHINILLQAGADIKITHDGDRDRNALMYAVQKSSYDIIKSILDSGIDTRLINSRDSEGNTAIMHMPFRSMFAPLINYYELIELFIQYGADINIANNTGETLLFHYCANPGMVKSIKPYLIKETIINTFKLFVDKKLTNLIPKFVKEFGVLDDHDSKFYSLQYILDRCYNINIRILFGNSIRKLFKLNAYRGFLLHTDTPINIMHYSQLLYQAVQHSISNVYYSFYVELLLNMHVPLIYKDNKGRDAHDLALGIDADKKYYFPLLPNKDISVELPTTNPIVLRIFNNYFNNKTLQLSCYLQLLNNNAQMDNIPPYIISNIIEMYS